MTALEAAAEATPPAASVRRPAASPPWRRAEVWLAAGALLALWFLSHPYAGVIHDARLYVGRALADLDPQGLGRDLLFANDGQSGFTLYRPMIRAGVTAFGAGPAALAATLVNLGLWFAAAGFLASRYQHGRRLAAVLVAVAILNPIYGGFDVFRYGEAFASPRPLAEAAVMAGLGLLASGRIWLAVLPMLVAAALHPVMALPGLMIGFIVHAQRDRRLWALPVLGGLGLIGAAVLRLPLAERLLVTADPAWMAVMTARSPYLFATWWRPGDWGVTVVQFALTALAAYGTTGRLRAVLVAILAAAAIGLLATLVLCDGLHDILALQLQPWRALWPLAVAANGALPLIAFALWRRGPRGHAALALLVLAWLMASSGLGGALAAVACLAAAAWALRGQTAPSERLTLILMGVAAFVALVEIGQALIAAAQVLILGPAPGSMLSQLALWRSNAPTYLAAIVLMGLASTHGGRRFRLRTLAILLVLVAMPAALLWDDRPGPQRRVESGRPDVALARALGPQPGALLWVGGDAQPWLLAGRPTWATSIQGASTVFSRPLAMAWDDRMRRLIAVGFTTEADRQPFTPANARSHANTVTGSATVCGWPDRPAAILIAGHRPIPDAVYWKPDPPEARLMTDGTTFFWQEVSEYTVVHCPAAKPISRLASQSRPHPGGAVSSPVD